MIIEDHLDNFESIEESWNSLLTQKKNPQIFSTPLWGEIYWRHLRRGNLHLLSMRQSEQVVGIAPVIIKDGRVTLLGDKDVCDYLDLIALPGYEKMILESLLNFTNEKKLILDLYPLLKGTALAGLLEAMAMHEETWIQGELLDLSYNMEVPSSWEEYLSSLPRKHRHELRRKITRLTREGPIGFCSLQPAIENIEDFFQLFRQRRDKALFLSAEREAFFRDIIGELGNRGWLKLYFLELKGNKVASTLCFDYGDTLSLYNSGFDPAYAYLSVGLIAKAWTIQEAIRLGRKSFDFLRGTEDYKEHLGGKPTNVNRYIIKNREFIC